MSDLALEQAVEDAAATNEELIAAAGVESDAPVQIDPAEEAAQKFTMLLPYVRKLGDALASKGGLVRVLHALAEFPLGATKPRLLNDAERQLFQICMELQGFKSTVVTNIMEKNAKAQQEAEAIKQASDTTSETEISNGGN